MMPLATTIKREIRTVTTVRNPIVVVLSPEGKGVIRLWEKRSRQEPYEISIEGLYLHLARIRARGGD